MKIFLSASFGRQAEIRDMVDPLQYCGHHVASRWLYEDPAHWPLGDDGLPVEAGRLADMDIDDICSCDIFVAFTESDRDSYFSGGRHFELGLAVGFGRRCFVVGSPENIFHKLEWITVLDTFEQFQDELAKMEGSHGEA